MIRQHHPARRWGIPAAIVIALALIASAIVGGVFLTAPAAESPRDDVVNPSFEVDTSGWAAWQSAITRVAASNAPDGSFVARVANTEGAAYSLDDSAATVAASVAGTTYTASASIAAASASAIGKTVVLALRETSSAGGDFTSTAVVLTEAFQHVEVTTTPGAAGTAIEVYAIQEQGGVAGDAFFIDDVRMKKSRSAPTPAATQTPTPSTDPSPTDTATPARETPSATLPDPEKITPNGPAGTWNLAFNDEFSGTAVDQAKWTTGWFGTGVTNAVNELEIACYNSDNVSVAAGSLLLSLQQKDERCGDVTQPFSGAMVNTNDKFEYTWGYAEARMYLPATGDGSMANWPVFWTNGDNWPQDGENDIAEGLRGSMEYRYHYGGASGEHLDQGEKLPGTWIGWHTFGSEWASGVTRYYYDGELVGEVTEGTDAPNYLILAYTQGNWAGPQMVPATVKVDYVRVWQR